MRIVVDLQVAQAAPQGPRALYAEALVRELAIQAKGRGEIIVALSDAFPDTIERLRGAFHETLPKNAIRVWYPPELLGTGADGNAKWRKVAELLREAFIAETKPDLVVLPSLWSGWQDRSVVSIPDTPLSPAVAILLPGDDEWAGAGEADEPMRRWHQERLSHCRRARYLLKVSGLSATKVEVSAGTDQELLTLESTASDRAAGTLLELGERESAARRERLARVVAPAQRPRLAYVSPLPPEQTGIAYYSAELLPELHKYYDIDVVVAQDSVEDSWINENCAIRSVAWFTRHGHKFDRVVYQFGNSRFHAHMWDLIKFVPGVAVIHDLFLGDAVNYRENVLGVGMALPFELYHSHGYRAIRPLILDGDRETAIAEFPCSFSPIRDAKGVIVHSQHARDLACHWYGEVVGNDIQVIPHLRRLPDISSARRTAARRRLGIPDDAFLICSFGVVNKTKLPSRLFKAWQHSKLRVDPAARLVFVGDTPDDHGRQLRSEIGASDDRERIHFTGWASAEDFQAYLAAADVAVQLRSNSRGETSGTVLDCMAHGIATICNAHGSFAEIPDEGVWKLDDDFEDKALVDALDNLWSQPSRRRTLGASAREQVIDNYSPNVCGRRYHEAIETAYTCAPVERFQALKTAMKSLTFKEVNEQLAASFGSTLPLRLPQRQLLVDVSVVARQDLRTGVQRVVRSVLKQLLDADLPGVRIEPVYTNPGMHGYFYAREFTQRFMGGKHSVLADEPMEAFCGDIFLGLDLHGDGIQAQSAYLEGLRDRGVEVLFVVHDLLPFTHPQWFPEPEEQNFERWLHCITRFEGAICVSQATAEELANWIAVHRNTRTRPYRIHVVHNGADIRQSVPSSGLPADAEQVLAALGRDPSFLVVGTIEPRKGVDEVLDAFELLWNRGFRSNLVLVGKKGWNVSVLSDRLSQHGEAGRKLFWLPGISDEFLEKVYKTCICLIAPSYAEGFGLPLIEAAQYGIPILARDIKVFREVAGANAHYFEAASGTELAGAIEEWHHLYSAQQHAPSSGMPFLSWEDVARQYVRCLLER
ncbi:glycosyltransferase [Aquibaculum arenosum]|uniref:Glycosyltransferase n=1 Tax=Aquibaculum arenosum TaxID=3032591 RepID=A0ABT5YMP8_9PROT|nr:glycosyltransferase [Fodinicurvata sp. CAU 1616]MDF2096149.1 glycosyltransferase [Fodinicurvata sp. CAU 1616]